MDGKTAEHLLELVGISVSKSTIPDDPKPPMSPSGLRIGMCAMTTRGAGEAETHQMVDLIDRALRSGGDTNILAQIKEEVKELCLRLPLPV
jgi:glycine hydroxymethyltransferase